MLIPKILAITGMIFSLLGTWLVAYELVSRFRGYAYEIDGMTYDGQGTPEKTPDFVRWEITRAKFMWAGLALITAGSVLQMIAVHLSA